MPDSPKVVFSRSRVLGEPIDVSVVIPVYNGASTLAEELVALAQQKTRQPFEVVISDNGSTDNSVEVAIRAAHQFAAFTVVDSGQVQGVSHARNEGARASRGSKVLICDADDVVSPSWVESFANGLDRYDAVGGAVRLDRLNPTEIVANQLSITSGLGNIFGFLPYAIGSCMGVRRQVLLALGGFDSSYKRGHEEADFAWRLQLAGYSLGWCPDAIVDYRQRPDSYGAARQNFYYAKSSMLLWCRYSSNHPLGPISFRGSLRSLLRHMLKSYKLILASTRRDHARALGWAMGVVAGHVDYRLLRRAPQACLMDPEAQQN
ncbi:glycosyltransferase family 2 protein [Pseudarthrobacter sp. NamB4]|uniref:glycosyltransferase family 2 protein n=1 Tax=Pseudarthrobacter sp. NamB4 TaxID=2576837 RepID=UPI0010FEB570|nr:glycosyltransferase [Pseudarthrobacter sp. NamB4]TLM74500.1 glycosyltransferase [Pseudarthrobacter sp. NamB4]